MSNGRPGKSGRRRESSNDEKGSLRTRAKSKECRADYALENCGSSMHRKSCPDPNQESSAFRVAIQT